MKAGRMTSDSERSCRIRRHVISWRSGTSELVGFVVSEMILELGMVERTRRVFAARVWIVRWSASMICVNV